MSRRQKLEAFLTDHPNDPLARYGLAMECANSGDHDAALGHYRQLLVDHPDYVVGYFHYGQLLARLGRSADARKVLSQGVTVAAKAGNAHAREEMEAALAALP